MKPSAVAPVQASEGNDRPPRTSQESLYVVQRGLGDGLLASIRGHILELANPSSGAALAPTPDDLFVAALASEVAWFARAFLRAHALPVELSVVANWQSDDGGPAEIALTITLSRGAEPARIAIATFCANGLCARVRNPPRIFVTLEGART